MDQADNTGGPIQGTESSRFKVAKASRKVDHTGDDDVKKQSGVVVSPGGDDNQADKKAFCDNTLDMLPHIDHYRNLLSTSTGQLRSRPTLLELRDLDAVEEASEDPLLNKTTAPPNPAMPQSQPTKFGWIQGVLARCVLNIFGVILFLRLTWVVGQAGIGLAVVVIMMATVVTTITSLSMSAISTNGIVKGGGAYYMISRSLGPEYGGAIGLVFSVANALAVAMHVVGFAETIRDLLQEYDMLMVDRINDVRIMSIITCIVLLIIIFAGMAWEAKAQLVLLVVLMASILNFFIGAFMPASPEDIKRGFVGVNLATLQENFLPSFRDENFFSIFAVFFPAATGILAGANISGDLKDAQKAIPKGTLLAIFITSLIYILVVILSGSVYVREQMGPIVAAVVSNATEAGSLLDFISNSSAATTAATLASSATTTEIVTATVTTVAASNLTCAQVQCPYGLLNDMRAIQISSAYGPITIAGIVSASFSSALACLVSAPKVFQAVCQDEIFPFIGVFAKGYGKGGDPRRIYILAFFIAIGCVLIGELNLIAPFISNFFLMSYALVNFSCFDASIAKSPGWRPSFKYYNKWLSLAGSVLCVGVMFVMSWSTALITFVVVTGLFFYVRYRKPDINWGSSTQAHAYKDALTNTHKLIYVDEHVKNYRPQILVLTGVPETRVALVDLCSSITKGGSLMLCANVLEASTQSRLLDLRQVAWKSQLWLEEHKTKSFYKLVVSESLRKGVQSLLQIIGLGKLRPNIMMMGFKRDWISAPDCDVAEYYNIINDAFDLHYGVGILRLQGGLYRKCNESSHIPPQLQQKLQQLQQQLKQQCSGNGTKTNGTFLPPLDNDKYNNSDFDTAKFTEPRAKFTASEDEDDDDDDYDREDAHDVAQLFRSKQSNGCIDVWWLVDDGGLTLLVPYLLSQRKLWKGCQLRIYIAASNQSELLMEQQQMASLLSKFRIQYSSIVVITDLNNKPSAESITEFSKLALKVKLSEEELVAQNAKTHRHLRLRELLKERSSDANLIVMSLPLPRRGMNSHLIYMCWLHTLTYQMPPILLLRGNQESVLTFYS